MSSNGGEIWGEEKGEIMDLGGGQPSLNGSKNPSECKWLNLSIFANFMLALIVLSSITKRGRL